MAAGHGGGYRGRVGWGEARPIVGGGSANVSGKRWVRERGFDAGQAFGERLFGSGCGPSSAIAELTLTAIKRSVALTILGLTGRQLCHMQRSLDPLVYVRVP